MAWSIFDLPDGQGEAATWADDLLARIGAPQTPGNEQMVYDWEVSEGGGGQFNPLNQGPDPKNKSLTSTGQQYGGGAADYVSWNAGLTGATDYLNMSQYARVRQALKSNDPNQAKQELFVSPWAGSHYGYGTAWSNDPFPSKTAPLDPSGGTVKGSSTTATDDSFITSILGSVLGGLIPGGSLDIGDWLERGALMLFGGILMIVGIIVLFRGPDRAKNIATKQSLDTDETRAQKRQERQESAPAPEYEGTHRKPKTSERPAKGKHAAPSEKTPGRHAAKPKSKTGPAGETPAIDDALIAG